MVAMVCNLAEKVDERPLNPGSLSIGYVQLGPQKKIIQCSGMSAIQGLLKY